MLFVSLISTYLIYKGRSIVGPYPHETWTNPSTGERFKPILNIPVTSASTFVLLMSSLFDGARARRRPEQEAAEADDAASGFSARPSSGCG